jgi:hypothetical protein
MIAIADVVGKPPSEAVFFEKFSRIACVIDEVLNEVGVVFVRVGWGHLGGGGVSARKIGRTCVDKLCTACVFSG